MASAFKEIHGIKVYHFPMPGINSGMFAVVEGNSALIVDPNKNEEAKDLFLQNNVERVVVVLTHEHYDHISGVNWLRGLFKDCHVICSDIVSNMLSDPNRNMAKYWDVLMMDKTPEEQAAGLLVKDENYGCTADETFSGDHEWNWQGHTLKALVAPGHAKGGILLILDDSVLFAGDNLVNGVGVICRLPGGKWKVYEECTLPILQALPDDMWVCPGHGNMDHMKNLRKYLIKFGMKPENV